MLTASFEGGRLVSSIVLPTEWDIQAHFQQLTQQRPAEKTVFQTTSGVGEALKSPCQNQRFLQNGVRTQKLRGSIYRPSFLEKAKTSLHTPTSQKTAQTKLAATSSRAEWLAVFRKAGKPLVYLQLFASIPFKWERYLRMSHGSWFFGLWESI